MVPPSDSILHHMHKLSEAARMRRAHTVNSNRQDPPPPYTPRGREDDPVDADADDDIDEEEDDDDDYDNEFDDYNNNEEESSNTNSPEKTTSSSSSSRVTLHIDASINISGDKNMIILPCRPGLAPSTTTAAAAATPTGSSSASVPSSLDSHALQSFQRQQQPKLAALAKDIISAALQDRRKILIPSGGGGRPSLAPLPPPVPVDVKIDVGVKVKGTGNVVCLGAKAGPGRHGLGQAGKRKLEEEVVVSTGGRKRRAQSEPCEMQMPKTKKGV